MKNQTGLIFLLQSEANGVHARCIEALSNK